MIPLCHVVFMMDASSSMNEYGKAYTAIKAYNALVESLSEVKGSIVRITLRSFTSDATTIYKDEEVHEATRLKTWHCPGSTCIYGSLFNTIYFADGLIKNKPGKVIIIVLSDGEDAVPDREYCYDIVKKYQKEKNWQFNFIGIGDNDFKKTALGLGFETDHIISSTDMMGAVDKVAESAAKFAGGLAKSTAL